VVLRRLFFVRNSKSSQKSVSFFFFALQTFLLFVSLNDHLFAVVYFLIFTFLFSAYERTKKSGGILKRESDVAGKVEDCLAPALHERVSPFAALLGSASFLTFILPPHAY
jgi:predicted membrane protein